MSGFELPNSMYVPHFQITHTGIIPNISLPRDWKELLPKFIEKGRQRNVENYVEELSQYLRGAKRLLEFKLSWNQGLLEHIAWGAQGALDLEVSRHMAKYVPHNLGGENGYHIAFVAMEYRRQLIQSGE